MKLCLWRDVHETPLFARSRGARFVFRPDFRRGRSREGARTGLSLSFQMAVPALFPFFVAGALLTDTGVAAALGRACAWPLWKLYGLPGEAAGALVLGLTGGYPVGVQAAADLYAAGRLDKAQAEHLLGFCNNTGPGRSLWACAAPGCSDRCGSGCSYTPFTFCPLC